MDGERAKAIGNAVEALWRTLERVRSGAGWERKLDAASYVRHREAYLGTQVPHRAIHDSSAIDYLNTFLSGFVGYMMPEDDTWAELVPQMVDDGTGKVRYGSVADLDAEGGVLKAAERCVQSVMAEYASSDYYSEMRMMAADYLVFGTGYIMACEEEGGGVFYRCFDPQEVCIAEDGKRKVDVFVRRFLMDARDVVRAYPGAEWPRLRQRIRGGEGESSDVECYEAMVPVGYLDGADGPMAMNVGDGSKWVHLLWVHDEGALAFEHGMEDFPVACVRRNRDNAKSPYGTGLVEECLPLIVELDDMGRIRQVMRQKNADPPMVMTYQLQGKFSSRPGARNYVSDMAQRPEPAVDQYNASELLADIQDMRGQLRSLMGADLFRNVMGSTDSRKTAYEVSERKNEAMTLLQMQIGTFRLEGVEPIFKRTLRILHSQGYIPFEEQEVRVRDEKGRTMGRRRMDFERFVDASRVELNSVFVRRVEAYLQYQQDVQSLQMLQAVQQVFPAALLNVDENRYLRGLLYGAGMPKAYMRELQDTINRQKQWAQQQEAMIAAEQANQLSGAMRNASAAQMGGTA